MKKINKFVIKFKNYNDLAFFNSEIKKIKNLYCTYFYFKNNFLGIISLTQNLNNFLPHAKEFGTVKKIKKIEIAYIKEYGKIIKP